MTEGLAIEIAMSMMRDRGIANRDYMIRLRHLILKPGDERAIDGSGQLLILISPPNLARITSKTGVFDLVTTFNEAQYVHSGYTQVVNLDPKFVNHVKFLQVIPKNKK